MIGLQELTSRKSLSWLEFADVIFGGTSDSRKYVCVRRLQLHLSTEGATNHHNIINDSTVYELMPLKIICACLHMSPF